MKSKTYTETTTMRISWINCIFKDNSTNKSETCKSTVAGYVQTKAKPHSQLDKQVEIQETQIEASKKCSLWPH